MPRLVVLVLATLLSTACSSDGGGASSNTYTAQITISELRGEAMPVVIPAPPITVTRGEAASITVTGAERTYTAEVTITSPGNETMATTSVEISRDGTVEGKTCLVQVVGRRATLRLGEDPEELLIESTVVPD